jgi:ATP-binding cassette, subfamily B (MDR/TAP), member 1
MANGIAMPMFALIFGNMTDSFSPSKSSDDIVSAAGEQSIWFLLVNKKKFFKDNFI